MLLRGKIDSAVDGYESHPFNGKNASYYVDLSSKYTYTPEVCMRVITSLKYPI